jgi:hypothetical protein
MLNGDFYGIFSMFLEIDEIKCYNMKLRKGMLLID